MGIRMNKKLGHALLDISVVNDRISDPRIDHEKINELNQQDPRDLVTSYGEFLAARGDEDVDAMMELELLKEITKEGFGGQLQSFTWGNEYHLPNVLLIQSLTHVKQWSRHEDPIDFAEYSLENPNRGISEPKAQIIDSGIFPYSGIYMDSRTGERCPDSIRTWRQLRDSPAHPGKELERAKALLLFAKASGYESTQEVQQYVVPEVPWDLKLFLEWSKIFPLPDTWMQLRPILYTYWA